MRAREPADRPTWLDNLIFWGGGAFVIWIMLNILIGIIRFLISGEWVP